MSQTVKLPFKLELNAPISGLLMNPRSPVNVSKEISKELPLVMNKLFRIKLKQYFLRVKNCNKILSPEKLFTQLVQSIRQRKKEQKPSYLHYTVQPLPSQPSVPKTPLFNLRIRQLKQSIFFKIKSFTLTQKSEQLTTILINRQSELLNHLIPKIEEKILTYGFRKIIEYSKEQKGRFLIVKVLERLAKVIVKRVGYGEFFNKARRLTNVNSKQELAIRKLSKISKQSTQLLLQQSITQLQLYSQSTRLETSIQQKKQLIQQVYSRNTERTVIVQQEREALRNLKYKLDQEVVEKSHVLTDKRRALMLMRARFNEEGKGLDGERVRMEGEVNRLERVKGKEEAIMERLEGIRRLTSSNHNNISYEHIITSIYHQLIELPSEEQEEQSNNNSIIQRVQQIIETTVENVLNEQEETEEQHDNDNNNNNNIRKIPTLETIEESTEYQHCRVELLEEIVRYMEEGMKNSNSYNNKGSSTTSRMTSLNSSVYSNNMNTMSKSNVNMNANNYPVTPRQQQRQQYNNQQSNNISSSQFTNTTTVVGRTLSQSRLVGSNSNGNFNNNVNNSGVNNNINNNNNNNSINSSSMTMPNNNYNTTSTSRLITPPLSTNEPLEFTRTKEELLLVKQITSMIIKKRYELQIKNAITEELEQLSELLVNDMKE